MLLLTQPPTNTQRYKCHCCYRALQQGYLVRTAGEGNYDSVDGGAAPKSRDQSGGNKTKNYFEQSAAISAMNEEAKPALLEKAGFTASSLAGFEIEDVLACCEGEQGGETFAVLAPRGCCTYARG